MGQKMVRGTVVRTSSEWFLGDYIPTATGLGREAEPAPRPRLQLQAHPCAHASFRRHKKPSWSPLAWERHRCPLGAQRHDVGLFLVHHWIPSQRPSRQQAQAATRPACHFLTLCGYPPGLRRGWWARSEDKAHQLSNAKSTGPGGHGCGYRGSPGESWLLGRLPFHTPPHADRVPQAFHSFPPI